MSIEDRIAMLEEEIEKLRRKPVQSTGAYSKAAHNCQAYFLSIKESYQHYGAQMACEQMARRAFREKHVDSRGNKNRMPCHYIQTEEDGEEYFTLFKEFLAVYQNYLKKDGGKACDTAC